MTWGPEDPVKNAIVVALLNGLIVMCAVVGLLLLGGALKV